MEKDSSNSCKPSSTNGYKIIPQNNRVKSGKKPGQVKSKNVLSFIKKEILKSPVINEDESPIKVAGKIMSTIGVFTNKISYVQAFENRKYESFVEMGILNKYIGTVCHDHNSIHKSFLGYKDAECNFHILRYCKAQYEIHKWEAIHEFMNFMLSLRDKVDEYKLEGKTCFSREEYESSKAKYLKLLDAWDKEYKQIFNPDKPKYFDEVRCLKTRLRENVDDHLRFLTDFRIDFTNNLAERRTKANKEKTENSWLFPKFKIC